MKRKWGLLVAFIGLAAAFVESIPGLIMAGVDALTVLFYIAGSIVSLTPRLPPKDDAPTRS